LNTPARTLYAAESRAMWLARPPVVVDCGVLAAMLFDETQADEAMDMLSGHALQAPQVLTCELASVGLKKRRAGVTATEIDTAFTDFAEQRLELHPAPATTVFALAQPHALSAYDAAYLWLAAELKVPLLAFDRLLAQAAARHLEPPP
jgi:predicted nucleic acid-binding protein